MNNDIQEKCKGYAESFYAIFKDLVDKSLLGKFQPLTEPKREDLYFHSINNDELKLRTMLCFYSTGFSVDYKWHLRFEVLIDGTQITVEKIEDLLDFEKHIESLAQHLSSLVRKEFPSPSPS